MGYLRRGGGGGGRPVVVVEEDFVGLWGGDRGVGWGGGGRGGEGGHRAVEERVGLD